MSSIRCLVVTAMSLVTFLLVTDLPATHCGYSSLNERCRVHFNKSSFVDGTENFYSSRMDVYNKCINETIQFTKGRNLTRIELRDCHVKCHLILIGFLKEDGTFDGKFPERTREEYTKYSNASVSFIDNLVKKYSECPKKVAAIYKSLSKTDKTECRMTGLYADCHGNITYQINNVTTEELCGIQ